MNTSTELKGVQYLKKKKLIFADSTIFNDSLKLNSDKKKPLGIPHW